jgi:hypothetical protein
MESTKSTANAEPRARSVRSTAGHARFRDLFLTRLQRIHQQRATYGQELTPDARLLIDRAMYSTYWDCVRLGLRSEARDVLGLTGG